MGWIQRRRLSSCSKTMIYLAGCLTLTIFSIVVYHPERVSLIPRQVLDHERVAVTDWSTSPRYKAHYGGNRTTGSEVVVGVFTLVDVGTTTNGSQQGSATEVGRLTGDVEFGFDNCDQSSDGGASYRLYIIYTVAGDRAKRDESLRMITAYASERVRLAALRGCHVTVAPSRDAVAHGNDVTAINEAMIGAYIDDNVDYFHLILPGTKPLSHDSLARNANHLIDVMHKTMDVYETGVIVENQPVVSDGGGHPLAMFFSRVHFDIFGLFLPISLTDVSSAVSIVIDVYRTSANLSTGHVIIRSDDVIELEKGTHDDHANISLSLATQRRPDVYQQDSETLDRYLSALTSSVCFRCPPTSKSGGSLRVIAMSLYGSERRYTMGAIRNAQLAPVTYPGWSLRFYVMPPAPGPLAPGAVPTVVLDRLRQLGADIAYLSETTRTLAPMLWRFTAVDDPSIDVFIVRDADSRLTPRDSSVVTDWLRQDAGQSVFHCVRDHPSHSGYSVSGGLWGARRAPMSALFNGSFSKAMVHYSAGYIEDMNFLGRDVWPRVKHVAYCHDSFSCDKFPASHPFPVSRIGSEHLGEVYDQFSVGRQGDIDILTRATVNQNCIPH